MWFWDFGINYPELEMQARASHSTWQIFSQNAVWSATLRYHTCLEMSVQASQQRRTWTTSTAQDPKKRP